MDPTAPKFGGMNSDRFSSGVRDAWGMECPECKTADAIYSDATVTIRLCPGGH